MKTLGQQSNIVLIGMSGAGKSTLGVLLAKALGMAFIDTDIRIQQREGKVLQQIIDQDGVDAFLRAEEAVLAGLRTRHTVIATGGSAVYSPKAMDHLRRNGTIVYLSVPYESILARLKNITTRGIVLRQGNTLLDAYNERLPLYKHWADLTLECVDSGVEDNVQRIIRLIQENT